MVTSKFRILTEKTWSAIHAANVVTVRQDHIRERRAHSNQAIFRESLIKGPFPKEWMGPGKAQGMAWYL